MSVGQFDDGLYLGPGNNQKQFFLPPPLHDAVEQTLLDHKAWEGVWCWKMDRVLHQADLGQAVFNRSSSLCSRSNEPPAVIC